MYYIYLIENVNGNDLKYKIGYTKNLDKRINQLKTSNPGELNIIYSYKSEWGRLLESLIHKKYSNNRVRNEWFNLTKKQVSSFLIDCEKKEKMLNKLKENYFFRKKYKL